MNYNKHVAVVVLFLMLFTSLNASFLVTDVSADDNGGDGSIPSPVLEGYVLDGYAINNINVSVNKSHFHFENDYIDETLEHIDFFVPEELQDDFSYVTPCNPDLMVCQIGNAPDPIYGYWDLFHILNDWTNEHSDRFYIETDYIFTYSMYDPDGDIPENFNWVRINQEMRVNYSQNNTGLGELLNTIVDIDVHRGIRINVSSDYNNLILNYTYFYDGEIVGMFEDNYCSYIPPIADEIILQGIDGNSLDVTISKNESKVKLVSSNGNVSMTVSLDKGLPTGWAIENTTFTQNYSDSSVSYYPVEIDNQSGLEFLLELREQPVSNVVTFNIDAPGLEFVYLGNSTYDVVKNESDETPGMFYYQKLGFHIYRPKIVDAVGSWVWGNLTIENGIMELSIPQSFLDSAVYPIKVDPTLGDITDAVVDSYEYDTASSVPWSYQNSFHRLNDTNYFWIVQGELGSLRNIYEDIYWISDNGIINNTAVDSQTFTDDADDWGSGLRVFDDNNIFVVISADDSQLFTHRILDDWDIQSSRLSEYTLDGSLLIRGEIGRLYNGSILMSSWEQWTTYDWHLTTNLISDSGIITLGEKKLISTDNLDYQSLFELDYNTIVATSSNNMSTWDVAPDGTMTLVDTWLPGDFAYPQGFKLSGDNDYWAWLCRDGSSDGWIKINSISADGTITKSWSDTLEYETATYTSGGDLERVCNGVYAISYTGVDGDGFVTTVELNNDTGVLGSVIDTIEFDTGYCLNPNLEPVYQNYFAVCYRGADNDGWMKTVRIYAGYNLESESQNEGPTSGSYNISLSPTVNVTVVDEDGDDTTVDFYMSSDGESWTHVQTNTSHPANTSVSCILTDANECQSTYYWNVTIKDVSSNITSDTYNFETTPYRTLFFNDTFPNENWIDSSHNMTHESEWENYTYGDPSTYYIDETMSPATNNINPNLDMYDSTYDIGPSPRTVFIDADTGYSVGIDTSNTDEPHLYKTTNGGATWTDQGGIDTATDPTDGWAGAVWYDQWTPGDTSGTKIYLAMTGDDYDEVEFNYIDTSGDSYRGSWVMAHDMGVADGYDGSPAICKGTDSILWLAGFGTTPGLVNSSDGGDTWTSSKPATLFDDDDDDCQLLPLPNGDIMCIYFDKSISDLGYFIYTKSTNSWSGWTKIDDGDTSSYCTWSASMNYDSGDIYVVINTNTVASTGDIQFWTYSIGNSTWWGDINIEANAYGYSAGIVVHIDSGDIYTFYEDGGSGAMDIYYQKSTDKGSSWSVREKVNTVTDDNRYCIGNFMSNERIYATWANEDLNDWHGNTLATYIPGKTDAWIRGKEIYKPSGYTWDKFYADVNNTIHSGFALSDNSTHYNISSGLTGNGDSISGVTNNSLYIFGNFSDASVNMGSWNITWVVSGANNAPTITGEAPVTGSTGISTTPTVYAIVTDADSDTMTCNFYTSPDGSAWTWRQTNSTVSTGTNISYIYSGATSYSTKYYWKVTADDGTDNTTSSTYDFTTESLPANNAPTQSGIVPANTSTGISLTPQLYVLCKDDDADNMNATWWWNNSGTWYQFASNWTSFANNTNITQTNSNFSVGSTTYYWSLNLTDGTDWVNNTYYFTTEDWLWIDVTNASWALGTTGTSIQTYTNQTGITFIADIDNCSVNTDLSLQITTDGATWKDASAPGADEYRLNASINTWVAENLLSEAGDTTISSDITAGQNETFDLRFDTPTTTSTGVQQTITVTATIVKH